MRIFKPRMGFLLLPALPLLVWTPASLAQNEKWEIDGNANLSATSFLGSIFGENKFVSFKTDGIERMRIFQRSGTFPGDFSDIDGVIRFYTNLHLNPIPGYNGDFIMPLGRWHGFDGQAGGPNKGDLTLTHGDLRLLADLGPSHVELTDGDLRMQYGTWNGTNNTPDQGNLSMTAGDLFVEDGAVGIGYKGTPGQQFELIDPDFYDTVFKRTHWRLGDLRDPVSPPSNHAALHIEAYGRYAGVGDEGHHVVFIKSYDNPADNFDTPDGISIQLEGVESVQFENPPGYVNPKNNFITFYNGFGEAMGAIEGFYDIGAGDMHGVTYKSGSADFAEYLLKEDPADTFQRGEIVGVSGGKISRVTQGADHILVVTRAPAVLGNAPQPQFEHLWETVAFLGQVPVLVVGEVNPGDYILPSGLEDGSGVAISPQDLQIEDLPSIVGTAWSVSVNGYVNTALGFKAINWGQVIEDANKPVIILTERIRQLELAMERLTGRVPSNN